MKKKSSANVVKGQMIWHFTHLSKNGVQIQNQHEQLNQGRYSAKRILAGRALCTTLMHSTHDKWCQICPLNYINVQVPEKFVVFVTELRATLNRSYQMYEQLFIFCTML